VRIALNLKSLPYRAIPVHLLKSCGEQLQPAYRSINPVGWCRRWTTTAPSSRSRWRCWNTWRKFILKRRCCRWIL
jgi:hypothetical protein